MDADGQPEPEGAQAVREIEEQQTADIEESKHPRTTMTASPRRRTRRRRRARPARRLAAAVAALTLALAVHTSLRRLAGAPPPLFAGAVSSPVPPRERRDPPSLDGPADGAGEDGRADGTDAARGANANGSPGGTSNLRHASSKQRRQRLAATATGPPSSADDGAVPSEPSDGGEERPSSGDGSEDGSGEDATAEDGEGGEAAGEDPDESPSLPSSDDERGGGTVGEPASRPDDGGRAARPKKQRRQPRLAKPPYLTAPAAAPASGTAREGDADGAASDRPPDDGDGAAAAARARRDGYAAYLRWCERVLGIHSLVEVRDFEYVDHLELARRETMSRVGDGDDGAAHGEGRFEWLERYASPAEEDLPNDNSKMDGTPHITVRGLAARRDISVGETVISVPRYSLLSVPSTVDHDPVLSRILGPKARRDYGWDDLEEYEVPLLVVAVLYHRSLGEDSPISRYVDVLLEAPTDDFPFLMDGDRLREFWGAGVRGGGESGVERLAREIRRDIHVMYDDVVGTLVREAPSTFAPPPGYRLDGRGGDEEWHYSYDRFRWAFAMVLSRHHYLPARDLDDGYYDRGPESHGDDVGEGDGKAGPVPAEAARTGAPTESPSQGIALSTVDEVVPPASQPTESWVEEAHNEERVVEGEEEGRGGDEGHYTVLSFDDDASIPGGTGPRHSFLAPLADLINFGPPCLRGRYDGTEHAFELVATCDFREGQEVTFYYSGECRDAMVASYGFVHPLVGPCPDEGGAGPEGGRGSREDDLEEANTLLEATVRIRERELDEARTKIGVLKRELLAREDMLLRCGGVDDDGAAAEDRTASDGPPSQHTLRGRPPGEGEQRGSSPSAASTDAGGRGDVMPEEERQIMEELG